jgi:SLOG family YspA-like protein
MNDLSHSLSSSGTSATSHVVEELQVYGYHPFGDDPDPRPLPETDTLEAAISGLFDTLVDPLRDTRLEPDIDDLLWSLTDLFHRKAGRVQRQLDDNEDRQRKSQDEQDGSEIRSVELERLILQGQTLLEKRSVFELLRDRAAEHYEANTGSAWRPRAGSMVNHKHMTASLIDSRDYIAAKRRAETEVHLPAGPKIAFSGGLECNDHQAIWAALDKVLAKHPTMVLIHGGSPRGAEKIAACWADNRKVTQIAFKPDWSREGKAAPFKRNDRMLEILPIGLVVFTGSGITDNLVDKAKGFGIPVFDFRKSGA